MSDTAGRDHALLVKVAGGVFVGTIGFEWTLIEVYNYFALTWISTPSAQSMKVALLLLIAALSAAVAAFVVSLRSASAEPREAPPVTFDQSLIDSLAGALRAKNYAEVIRIGVALNRPLFEAGNFATRLRIGRIVEEAAALTGRKDIQVLALVDSVGWSLVELGKYPEAERSLRHGIELSSEISDPFFEAKGLRHLGVIARRTSRFGDAERFYKESLAKAGSIRDEHEKEVLVAGLHYAFACLYFATNDLVQASSFIKLAIDCFRRLKDGYRLNMSLVTRGDIEFRQGLGDKARDTYRSVLREADRNTEKLQVVRSYLGLAEVHISEFEWDQARESLDALAEVDLKDFRAERERLEQLRTRLLKPA